MDFQDNMQKNARRAAAYLKCLAHEHRLLILCKLAEGELSVGELQADLPLSQPAISQHLRRLCEEGLITSRPEKQRRLYSLQGNLTRQLIYSLYDVFCQSETTNHETTNHENNNPERNK